MHKSLCNIRKKRVCSLEEKSLPERHLGLICAPDGQRQIALLQEVVIHLARAGKRRKEIKRRSVSEGTWGGGGTAVNIDRRSSENKRKC